MAPKRTYLFLNNRNGQGKMFTINPKGLIFLALLLVVGGSIGAWALFSGALSFEKWKFRLNNISKEQQTIQKQLQVIDQQDSIVRKELSHAFSSLPLEHYLSDSSSVDSLVLDTLLSYSLEEMVERSRNDAATLQTIISATHSDSSYWYKLPLSLPVPLTTVWFVKNRYGMMADPISGVIKMHKGIDISAERGEPVIATGSGRVKKVETDRFFGKKITISHSYGYSTLYAHLAQTVVRRGDYVYRGDTIGTVGETGWTTSPLVHYEIQKDGESFDPTIILWYLNRS